MASKWLTWTGSQSRVIEKTRERGLTKLTKPGGKSGDGGEKGGFVSSVSLSVRGERTYYAQLCCYLCGTRFDTHLGYCRHQIYGCSTALPQSEPDRVMPSCSYCGSYCLYREEDGSTTCETCGRKT